MVGRARLPLKIWLEVDAALENLIPNVCASSHRRQSTGRASRTQNRLGRPLCYYFEARLVDSNPEEVLAVELGRGAALGPKRTDKNRCSKNAQRVSHRFHRSACPPG